MGIFTPNYEALVRVLEKMNARLEEIEARLERIEDKAQEISDAVDPEPFDPDLDP